VFQSTKRKIDHSKEHVNTIVNTIYTLTNIKKARSELSEIADYYGPLPPLIWRARAKDPYERRSPRLSSMGILMS
jgi:hypothetical protein